MPEVQAVPIPDDIFWANDDIEADHFDRYGYERAPEYGPLAFSEIVAENDSRPYTPVHYGPRVVEELE